MSGTDCGACGCSAAGGGGAEELGLSRRGGALKQAAIPTAIAAHSGSASGRDNLTAMSQ
jgi:hypothetical protein